MITVATPVTGDRVAYSARYLVATCPQVYASPGYAWAGRGGWLLGPEPHLRGELVSVVDGWLAEVRWDSDVAVKRTALGNLVRVDDLDSDDVLFDRAEDARRSWSKQCDEAVALRRPPRRTGPRQAICPSQISGRLHSLDVDLDDEAGCRSALIADGFAEADLDRLLRRGLELARWSRALFASSTR